MNQVFHDAVPRTSFGEPAPDPPLLGVYGLLSAMERLGHGGGYLEAQVSGACLGLVLQTWVACCVGEPMRRGLIRALCPFSDP